ncbi:MAG: hypothetical protein DRG50_01170 [Deltaproteobacteria bacterium]|nr:MAG: hypothetical protein DRG50_01170 [Deltaproteobacteria bacterium]
MVRYIIKFIDDRIDLIIKKLKVQHSETAKMESPLRLTSAIIDVNGYLRAKEDALKGRVLLEVHRPKVAVGAKAAILADLFKNMGSFNLIISIDGTLDQPSMTLSSSATKTLASGLQNLIKPKLKGVEKDIKKAIDSQLKGDLKAASRETDVLEKLIQNELSSRLGLAGRTPKISGEGKASEEEEPLDLFKGRGLPSKF